jgi:uncharacterized RDD family membrane protein YckC
VDVLLFSPLFVTWYLWGRRSQTATIGLWVTETVVFYAYNLYFHAKSGQTVGKRFAGIRVVTPEGQPPGWRRSFLRNLDDLAFVVVGDIVRISTVLSIPAARYATLSTRAFTALNRSREPWWLIPVTMGWYALEVALVVFTHRRRALHDLIGNTVVIGTPVTDRSPGSTSTVEHGPALPLSRS